MEWSTDMIIELINGYRERPLLWDPEHPYYKLLARKNEAWGELAINFNTDIGEVKRKVNSLLASYRRERQRENYKKVGPQADQPYHSVWFAYKYFDFLQGKERRDKRNSYLHRRRKTRAPRAGYKHACSKKSEAAKWCHYAVEPLFSARIWDQVSDVEKKLDKRKPFLLFETENLSATDSETLREQFKAPKIEHDYSYEDRTASPHDAWMKKMKPTDINPLPIATQFDNSTEGEDQYDNLGKIVAAKLRASSANQRVIAEKIINDVLFEAELGKLNQFCKLQMHCLNP